VTSSWFFLSTLRQVIYLLKKTCLLAYLFPSVMDCIGLSIDRTVTRSNYIPRDGWYEGPESNSFSLMNVQQGFLHGFVPHTRHIFDGDHSRHLEWPMSYDMGLLWWPIFKNMNKIMNILWMQKWSCLNWITQLVSSNLNDGTATCFKKKM